MSASFRPPSVVDKTIGWRQIFGFAQRDAAFWGRVRAAQLALQSRYVPFNIGLLVLNAAALTAMLGDGRRSLALTGAGAAALIVVMAMRWRFRRRNHREAEVGQRAFWMASFEIVAFGLGGSALLALAMARVDSDGQAMLVMFATVAMVASAFATAVMPAAGIGLVTIIAATTVLALPAGTPVLHGLLPVGFATLVALMARSIIARTAAMMDRMRTESENAEQSDVIGLLLREFETNGSDWLFEIDAHGLLMRVSPRLAEVAGRSRERLIGTRLIAMLGDARLGSVSVAAVAELTRQFAAQRPIRDCIVPVAAAGETRWWQLSATPKLDATGHFTGYRGVGADVTEVRAAQDHISRLARYDPLTGLANRGFLRDTITAALRAAHAAGDACALLFIDLDRFKLVNDSIGHHAGDALLREVASRLRAALGEQADIGRLGGDEFAVLLSHSSTEAAEAASRAIVAGLALPFELDGHVVSIGASVGFAIGPADGASVDLLLRSADLALYEVKGTGRGHACRFVPAIQEKADERRALEFDLRGALERGELALAFQPVVEASDERIVGFEALLRWHHPTLGTIAPLKFIPIAEETRLIVPIGAWVIEEACRWAARWPAAIRIAVNLSPAQFDDRNLAQIVRNALADHRILPERLELEITESLFLHEQPSTTAMLAELKAIGVRFALDDFGTGYSSLGYLHKAEFSRIKIDSSFVQRATTSGNESVAIIRAIVALAGNLGMMTTAEGTETRAEFEAIRALGCHQVQGYLFGRPMSPEAATELALQTRSPRLALVG